nr:MAG TPA: hypothetical protein [Caudoviricetes sp.]
MKVDRTSHGGFSRRVTKEGRLHAGTMRMNEKRPKRGAKWHST